MKRAFVLPVLLLAACGGGSNVDPALVTAAQCSALGLEDLDAVFSPVAEFLSSIPTPPMNVTYTPPDFSIDENFGTIDGAVTSTDDISDGIDAGESATATWSINPALGVLLGGSGVFNISRTSAFVFEITGSGSITDGTCIFDATNVDLTLDLQSGLGPVGSFDFNAVSTSGPISGTMTFDGSDTAEVTATFMAMPVFFTIDLNTFTPRF